jgi:exopolysaccharide production protein ExoQ
MLKNFERWYFFLSFLYLAGGLIPVRAEEGVTLGNNDERGVILQYVIFVILLPLLYAHRDRIKNGISNARGVLAVSIFCILSAAWSLDIHFTFRRGVILLFTTLYGIYFAERFDWEEQLELLYKIIAFELITSFFLALAFPSYGVSQMLHAGAWRGLFNHKNNLGRFTGLSLLFLFSVRPPHISRVWRAFLFILALVELGLAQSGTATVATLLPLLAFPALILLRVRRRETLPLWFCVVPIVLAVGFLAFLNVDIFLELLGKNATLTGRIPLWAALVRDWANRPLLGFGYGAFWETTNQFNTAIRRQLNWSAVPHSHNGFVDCLLDTGALGLLLLLAVYFRALGRAIRLFREKAILGSEWPLLFMLFFALFNVTESSLFRAHTFLWVPFVWICVTVKRFTTQTQEEEEVYSGQEEAAAVLV